MKSATLLLLMGVLIITGCGRETRSSATGIKHFSEYGLAFDYPESLSVEVTDGPVRLISLQSRNGISVRISIYPTRTLSPEQVQTIALNGFRKATARTGDSRNLRETESEQHIAGELRTGMTFNDRWREGERITQFYTFTFADGVASFVLQSPGETLSEAESIYDIVLGSLTAQPSDPVGSVK